MITVRKMIVGKRLTMIQLKNKTGFRDTIVNFMENDLIVENNVKL